MLLVWCVSIFLSFVLWIFCYHFLIFIISVNSLCMSTKANPLKLALLTTRMSSAAGGLAVSIPSLASGLSSYDDFDVHL